MRPTREVWATEFEPLVVALNDMAGKLSDREQDLRAANRHLEELASLDSLSGLANRRGFDTRLAADWRSARGLGHPVALLMIDVDHFKLFNDRYGHVEGDVCLRRVGKLLEAVKGPNDLPARYGGEEFALLMPGTDLDQALAVAERLRRAVEELCITHAACPSGRVTISVGVAAMMPGVDADPGHLIEAADAGLYSAKRRGRNCVVAHGAMVLAAFPVPAPTPRLVVAGYARAGGSVADDDGAEIEHHGVARRRLDAGAGAGPGDDQRIDVSLAKLRSQYPTRHG